MTRNLHLRQLTHHDLPCLQALLAADPGYARRVTGAGREPGANAADAEPFWTALGYRPTEPPKPYRAGETATQVTAWTRSVSPAAPPGRPSSEHDERGTTP